MASLSMFMRYYSSAIGHKTTYEEIKCLLNDCDALDEIPFKLESKHDWEDQCRSKSGNVEMDSGDDGDEMEEDGSDDDEVSSLGTERDEEGEDKESEREEVSDGDRSDSDDGNDKDDKNMSINVTASALLVDDDLLDEMDEFRYSGWDQVVEDEVVVDQLAEDALGAEDGENVDWDEEDPHGYL